MTTCLGRTAALERLPLTSYSRRRSFSCKIVQGLISENKVVSYAEALMINRT